MKTVQFLFVCPTDMTELIQVGPGDNKKFPYESLGLIFYNELRKNDPNRILVVDSTLGMELTCEKLLDLSLRVASSLAKLGVKKGDVITIISQNNWKYVITMIAGFYIGAKVNLLNHDYTSGELKHFLAISKPVAIFCTNKTLENISKLKNESFFPDNVVVYDTAGSSNNTTQFDKLLESSDGSFSPVALDPREEVALMLTSSGTTGWPKLVMLTHANFRATMNSSESRYLNLTRDDSFFGLLPFFHVFGSGIILAGILYGGKSVILDKFVPDKFLKIIQDHKINKLLAVPPILLFLAKSPLVAKYDVSSITDVICGAAAISKELEVMVEERLNVKCVRQLYGMTEVAGAATIVPFGVKKSGTVGKVLLTFKIKVCDVDTGKMLPANQVGELRIFGDGIMKGYLGNVEETAASVDEDGFLKSGDLGYYDEEGFFYIVDRLKEIIKYKGYQVSPAELESLLIQHPSVNDAGVVGIPDERAGEVPLAFVVKQPNKNVTEEEIVRYVEENVSIQKRLYGGVRFVNEIPKSASGKILRKELKKLI